MTPDANHPYDQLTPDVVLDALVSVGLYGDGRLTPLSSYENRVYQIHLDEPYLGQHIVVAKFYRPDRWSLPQILEEHALAAELQANDIPVVAPLVLNAATLHQAQGFAFSLSPWRGGRRPELDDGEVLEWIGRFLARIHQVGAARPFNCRPSLDLHSFGTEARDWLQAHDTIPLEAQHAWHSACDEALQAVATHSALTGQPHPSHIRVHGDCHPGNILWTPTDRPGGGPHFVDLDDARTGPAIQDLWMLLSGDRPQRTLQLNTLLDGYEQCRPFDRRELVLLEPLRTLRLIHYSAWLARRWNDPIFPINFPWFGTPDYWHGQVAMLHEQIQAMQAAPLHCGQ
jgi:Ser/Thr protein kinase RdoA (MazF antagonist)